MDFSEAIHKIGETLDRIGSHINENAFDGLIVKKLESSNTLDEGRTTNQTHIAITGNQMDLFPYVRADGYFEVQYDKQDSALKKFFVAQIPVYLHKENITYLDSETSLSAEEEHLVHVSIVRSRRKDAADQIQMSMTNLDSADYVAYRRIVHAKSYMILLKRREQLLYDLYCVKESDGQNNLQNLNNAFYKQSTNTVVKLDEIMVESDDSVFKEIKQKFNLSDLPECFNTSFAHRYIKSLMAKPFVILTGNSGTGKTRISKQFAEYLEVRDEDDEKNWVLVPVGADWTDNTKILGFYNPLADDGKGKYEKTEIMKLIERANRQENQNIPFFIILDEMNLSHVERYFADFLSHMETPDLNFVLDGYPGKVKYPENLFVVGTVNIDETTYMFSPKVLDRANVIEFKPDEAAVLDMFLNPSDNEKVKAASDGTAEAFAKMAYMIRNGQCNLEETKLSDVKDVFERIYKIVDKCGYEFAYRTVREIRQYISAAYDLTENKDSFELKDVIDEQLIQKILPKIHGNKKEIGNLLEELSALCTEKELTLSGEKIEKMKGKLAQIQYASFI